MPFIETIIRGGRVSLGLSDRMLAGIRPEIFALKPRVGDTIVNANHPAFVFGHLSTYPVGWIAAAGLPPVSTAAAPPNYADLFAAGKECHDDPEGTIYPPMPEIVEVFKRTHGAALETFSAITDAQLDSPNPREGRIREMFPTLGGLLMFYTTSHMMMHLGQVSTWRRCFGLGSAM